MERAIRAPRSGSVAVIRCTLVVPSRVAPVHVDCIVANPPPSLVSTSPFERARHRGGLRSPGVHGGLPCERARWLPPASVGAYAHRGSCHRSAQERHHPEPHDKLEVNPCHDHYESAAKELLGRAGSTPPLRPRVLLKKTCPR